MEKSIHRFHELFAQLGLPQDDAGIEQFITTHAQMPENIKLSEATFWSPAQAAFLRDACLEDADWAMLADQLNLALRGKASG